MDLSELSGAVIGAAIEVHRELGPGLLESAYELALERELGLRKVSVQRQVAVPLEYKGIELGDGFRLDLLVDDALVVEVKAVDRLQPIHDAQLLTYLKLANKRLGLLINFNERTLKEGVKRVANGL
ncbi:MAG TPA: GxxExxY protein [Azospira sp.]|nr:GxxExxY protein [Azospira sp.]